MSDSAIGVVFLLVILAFVWIVSDLTTRPHLDDLNCMRIKKIEVWNSAPLYYTKNGVFQSSHKYSVGDTVYIK